MNTCDRRAFVRQSALLAAGSLLPSPAFAQGAAAATHPFFRRMNRPEVIAHRGGGGQWPEETLEALREARKIVDILEIDVHGTCDGQLVLMHDAEVDRTTDGKGSVNKYRFDEGSAGPCEPDSRLLSSLDAGSGWPYCRKGRCETHPFGGKGIKVPTLRAVLDEFRGWTSSRMIIEIKQLRPSITAQFCELLNEPNYMGLHERLLVASLRSSVLQDVRERCPGVATSLDACGTIRARAELSESRWLQLAAKAVDCDFFRLFGHLFAGTRPRFRLRRQARPQIDAIQVPRLLVTKDFVGLAQEEGLKVHAWTINDPVEMWEMMDAGVDGIITDYPSLLIERRKFWRESQKNR